MYWPPPDLSNGFISAAGFRYKMRPDETITRARA